MIMGKPCKGCRIRTCTLFKEEASALPQQEREYVLLICYKQESAS
jgi:hypothetical protein